MSAEPKSENPEHGSCPKCGTGSGNDTSRRVCGSVHLPDAPGSHFREAWELPDLRNGA